MAFGERQTRPTGSRALARDTRGLTTVEWVILLSLVAIACIVAWRAFGESLAAQANAGRGTLDGLEMQRGELPAAPGGLDSSSGSGGLGSGPGSATGGSGSTGPGGGSGEVGSTQAALGSGGASGSGTGGGSPGSAGGSPGSGSGSGGSRASGSSGGSGGGPSLGGGGLMPSRETFTSNRNVQQAGFEPGSGEAGAQVAGSSGSDTLAGSAGEDGLQATAEGGDGLTEGQKGFRRRVAEAQQGSVAGSDGLTEGQRRFREKIAENQKRSKSTGEGQEPGDPPGVFDPLLRAAGTGYGVARTAVEDFLAIPKGVGGYLADLATNRDGARGKTADAVGYAIENPGEVLSTAGSAVLEGAARDVTAPFDSELSPFERGAAQGRLAVRAVETVTGVRVAGQFVGAAARAARDAPGKAAKKLDEARAARRGERSLETTRMDPAYRGEDQFENPTGQKVKYFDKRGRQQHRVRVENGRLVDSNGELLNTGPDAIYVMDRRGRMYVADQDVGRIQHSSFLGGKPVAAAGHVQVRDGRLISIDNKSGHYQAPAKRTDQALEVLEEEGLDVDGVQVADYELNELGMTGVERRQHRSSQRSGSAAEEAPAQSGPDQQVGGTGPSRSEPTVRGGASLDNLNEGQRTVLQKFADENNVEVSVVGSRAGGTPGDESDWDYVIPGANNKIRKKAKQKLPRGPAGGADNRGRDFLPGPVDPERPSITFRPRPDAQRRGNSSSDEAPAEAAE